MIDLHRHLEGSIRKSTIVELAHQYNLPIPEDINLLVTDRPISWLTHVDWAVEVLSNIEACRRVAYEAVIDASTEGLTYLELRFSPYYMARPHNLSLSAVTQAVIEGIRQGRVQTGLNVALIGILSRTYGLRACMEEVDVLLDKKDALVAIDLAGDEARWPAELFKEHFNKVHAAGLGITIHAGERDGPESIWAAIRDLHATRIGHGIHAVDDPILMDHLAQHNIGIEVCPTSNIQAKLVPNYANHPLKTFLEHGILATINTDNPVIGGYTLQQEYDKAPELGLTAEQVAQLHKNAQRTAFRVL